MAITSTPSLTMQDLFSTTTTASFSTSDTTLNLNSVPTGTEGFLTLFNSTGTPTEIVYYNAKGASTVTIPSATQGAGRGMGGTTPTAFASGTTVKQTVVSDFWKELQNYNAMNRSAKANSITADTSSHLSLSAGTSKLVKTTVLRQNDTTNAYQVGNSVILTGYGLFATGATTQKTDTVTFGVTFLQAPIVTVTYAGDNISGSTTFTNITTSDKAVVTALADQITTTSFRALIRTADGTNWNASTVAFYTWTAIGEI